ncbi:MAG: T9SS type A sorting domain-containing protein [Ignavibacteria bacterium]
MNTVFVFLKKIFFSILPIIILNQTALFSQSSFSVPGNSIFQFKSNSEKIDPQISDERKIESGVQSVPIIKIIESQSNPGHAMDTTWRFYAQGMGYSASIVSQTFLNDTSFIQETDVLIISSGVIDLPPNRVDAIRRFITHKKNTYLQCEYLSTYSPNSAFANLVNQLGGVFSWTMTLNGDLQPMTVLGSLSSTPNVVTPLSYFWYGNAGTGNQTIENYLQKGANYFGFIFRPPNANYGILITNSDQDWIRTNTSPALMKNILYKLVTTGVGIININNTIPDNFQLEQNYPNPFNPTTTINFSIPASSNVKIKVYDALGQEVATLVDEFKSAGNYSASFTAASTLTSGIYFYTLTSNNFTDTKKLMLLK